MTVTVTPALPEGVLPPVGTLWVSSDGTAYRLRSYGTDWESPTFELTKPSYSVNAPDGMSTSATTLPEDAVLTWMPEHEVTR